MFNPLSSARPRPFRAVLTAGVLVSAGALLLPATPAVAVSAKADLAITAAVGPAELPPTGGVTTLTVGLRNIGSRPSKDAEVRLTLPAGATFPGDGVLIPEGWTCNPLEASCIHTPVAAGEAAADLSIPFLVPAGTEGETVAYIATVSTESDSSAANNVAQAVVRYLPGVVDLVVDTLSATREILPNESTILSSSVQNTGNVPSGDITVVAALPAGMTNVYTYSEDWDCTFGETEADGQNGWKCRHAPLAPGQTSKPVTFGALLTDAKVGDVVSLTSTASTTTPETSTDNNTASQTFTVIAGAAVRGMVWVDANRNGVRDTGETGASVADGDIQDIYLRPEDPDGLVYGVALNANGTYQTYVRPGTYRVEFIVRDPHEFIDSADSDVTYYLNETGGYNNIGYTDWFTVAVGDEIVLDAAVN